MERIVSAIDSANDSANEPCSCEQRSNPANQYRIYEGLRDCAPAKKKRGHEDYKYAEDQLEYFTPSTWSLLVHPLIITQRRVGENGRRYPVDDNDMSHPTVPVE